MPATAGASCRPRHALVADGAPLSVQSRGSDRPAARTEQTAAESNPLPPATGRAAPVFSERLSQDLVVQRLVGHEPLEPGVLLLQGFASPGLADLQAARDPFPSVERLLTDPMSPAQSGLRLLEDRVDRVADSLHCLINRLLADHDEA